MWTKDEQSAFWRGFTSVFTLNPGPLAPLDLTYRGRPLGAMSAGDALALDWAQVQHDLGLRFHSETASAAALKEQDFLASLKALAANGPQPNPLHNHCETPDRP